MLHISDMSYRIAGRLLFEGASAMIPDGHKVGLVGLNGTGKTTLLHLIEDELAPDQGTIQIRRGVRTARLAQEAPSGSASLLETVLASDTERAALLREAEGATDPGRIAEIHTRLADIGAHAAPAKASTILAGLGFDTAAQSGSVNALSGGWRMRVALAAVLFAEPDLLLLDEPTNHLDLEASLWLEGYLKGYPHTMIVVSHDRDLLNKSVDHILHLHSGKLTLYNGGYDRFEAARRERQLLEVKLKHKQDVERQHIQAFVDRFRYKATKARQAQSRLKMLARMQPIAAVVEDRMPSFRFSDPDALAPPLITFEATSVGYIDQQPVLRNLNLRIDPDDRIALLGANGNGKSTFAKLLAGRLRPMAGTMNRSAKIRVGYFAQHQVDELTASDTAFGMMRRTMPDERESVVRARLGQFGLAQDKANTAAEALSGGEKARLLLALMSHAAPHILILDEPTNHLDVDARQTLVQAINEYAGTVILISHDPHLVGLVADRLWLVADGTVTPFDGDLDDYRRHLLEERRLAVKSGEPRAPRPNRKQERRIAASARVALGDLRRQVKRAEVELARLTAERSAIETALADPETYAGPPEKAAQLNKRRADAASRIATAETRWLEATAALEVAD